MESTFWLKQTKDKPLFEDLIWSRPETASRSGKLLIVGGDSQSFKVPAEAFVTARQAGAGVIKVLLPETVKSFVPKNMWADIEFGAGLKNGGFGRSSIAQMLDLAAWADGVLVAGGVGRNSQTAIALEGFLKSFKGRLAITHDALDIFSSLPGELLERPNTLVVMSFGQLQKSWQLMGRWPAISSGMGLLQLVEQMHNLSLDIPAIVITKHQEKILVACNGKVSTTPSKDAVWRVRAASKASVWWLQNPGKPFEAITSSLII